MIRIKFKEGNHIGVSKDTSVEVNLPFAHKMIKKGTAELADKKDQQKYDDYIKSVTPKKKASED